MAYLAGLTLFGPAYSHIMNTRHILGHSAIRGACVGAGAEVARWGCSASGVDFVAVMVVISSGVIVVVFCSYE